MNEAMIEKLPTWKMSSKVFKNYKSPKEMINHEKESAETDRKIRTCDSIISKRKATTSLLNVIIRQKENIQS